MKTLSAFAILTVVSFLAAGCEPEPTHYWYSPLRTLEQAEQDCAECRKRADTVAAETAAVRQSQIENDPKPESKEDKKRYDDRVDTLSTWDEVYLRNVFSGCMKSRGYFEVETDRLPRDVKKKSLPGGDVAGR